MKNVYFFILSFFFISVLPSKSFTQTFFIEAGAQYGFPILTQQVETSELYRYGVVGGLNVIRETQSGSFSTGQGFQGNLTLGVMLSKNTFFSLKSAYFQGQKSKPLTTTLRAQSGDYIATIEGKSSALTFSPMLNFQTNSEKKLNAFMGMGLIIGLPKYQQIEKTSFLEELEYYIYDYDSELTIGFENQLGILYKITPKLDVKASLNVRIFKYYPKSASATTYEVNGENQLASLTTYEKEREYGDNFSYLDQVEHENRFYFLPDRDETISSKRNLFEVPMSTLAFDLGVRYSF